MKKLFFILSGLIVLLNSCQKISYTQDLDSFKDVIFVSEDLESGEITVSDYGSVSTIGDLATATYGVDIKNVKLFEGASLRSCKVSNLTQYYQEKSESEKDIALYYFFRQEGHSYVDGDLDVNNMRYGFLTGTYWLSFDSEEQFRVWSTPRVRSLYAVRNSIISPLSPSGAAVTENAIHPAYRFAVNVAQQTVTIKGQGVSLPQNVSDTSQTLRLRSIEFKDIPIVFTSEGYELSAAELVPLIDGEPAADRLVTEMTGKIAFDYEGEKTLTYKMKNQYGDVITVRSDFALLQNPND